MGLTGGSERGAQAELLAGWHCHGEREQREEQEGVEPAHDDGESVSLRSGQSQVSGNAERAGRTGGACIVLMPRVDLGQ